MEEPTGRLPLIGAKAPADRRPSGYVVIPPPGSCGTAKDRDEKAGADYGGLD